MNGRIRSWKRYDYDGNILDNRRYFEGKRIMEADEKILSMMGRYPVIKLSLKSAKQQDYRTAVLRLRDEIVGEFDRHMTTVLSVALSEVVDKWDKGQKFIAIMDEWDAVIRDSSATKEDQKRYLEFLRSLFKSSGTTDKIFAAAYLLDYINMDFDGN